MSWELRLKTEFDCCNNDLMSKQKTLKTIYSYDKERAVLNIEDGNGVEFRLADWQFLHFYHECQF